MVYFRLNCVVLYVVLLTKNIAFSQNECTSNRITNFTLSDDAIISWEPLPTEGCTIDYYLVYTRSGQEPERFFNVTDTVMDISSYMQICATAIIHVIPVSSEGIQGSNYMMITTMPLPSNVNFTIDYIRVSPSGDDGSVLFEWGINQEWRSCVRHYHLVIYDEDGDEAVDHFPTTTSYTLTNLVACTNYNFGVRAMYNLEHEGPLSFVKYVTPSARLPPPALESISLGSTTANVTFSLQPYLENRCHASSLSIFASPYFSVVYPITDQINRPAVTSSINNLLPDTLYLLNVTVNNTAGMSRPTLLAVQTLN
ncbi:hypothetical protein NQ317_012783 [Molorchus minor]|uniref:Fibronectin type-III domain-containing protein n=1 Tax=Molorchus minor TaxID=1323400 RepID=A0ABQ9K6F0_9CUCU|nr:hypothetical protein NQ317_012783 [Molorchus minor]